MNERFRQNVPGPENDHLLENDSPNIEQAEETQEKTKHPDYDLIAEKILRCRAITAEELGSTNVYQAASYLYDALYHTKLIKEEISPSEKYPDRLTILTQELNLKPQKIPSREEFIEAVRHAMTKEVNFEDCLRKEEVGKEMKNVAEEQMKNLMEQSEKTVIWTDGDTYGVPEKLPGSKEQFKKIAKASFQEMRIEIAKKRGPEVARTEVLSVASMEGKMKCIPKIIEEFKTRGIEKIIIIDDLMGNLTRAREEINKISPEIEVFPIWTRVGRHRDETAEGKTLEQWSDELNAIERIGNLKEKIDENKIFDGRKVGSIVDLDGPIYDDDKRRGLQTRAVIESMERRGWLGELKANNFTTPQENPDA